MERKYNVGIDSNSISMQIKIATSGTCFTSATLDLTGGQKIIKAESNSTSNGNITKTLIGKASELNTYTLTILTIVDFSALPQEQIKAILTDTQTLKVNLSIGYIFGGGFSAEQTFDYDLDDYTLIASTNQVIITKFIDFTNNKI